MHAFFCPILYSGANTVMYCYTVSVRVVCYAWRCALHCTILELSIRAIIMLHVPYCYALHVLCCPLRNNLLCYAVHDTRILTNNVPPAGDVDQTEARNILYILTY